jgi:hypothetical protein
LQIVLFGAAFGIQFAVGWVEAVGICLVSLYDGWILRRVSAGTEGLYRRDANADLGGQQRRDIRPFFLTDGENRDADAVFVQSLFGQFDTAVGIGIVDDDQRFRACPLYFLTSEGDIAVAVQFHYSDFVF